MRRKCMWEVLPSELLKFGGKGVHMSSAYLCCMWKTEGRESCGLPAMPHSLAQELHTTVRAWFPSSYFVGIMYPWPLKLSEMRRRM